MKDIQKRPFAKPLTKKILNDHNNEDSTFYQGCRPDAIASRKSLSPEQLLQRLIAVCHEQVGTKEGEEKEFWEQQETRFCKIGKALKNNDRYIMDGRKITGTDDFFFDTYCRFKDERLYDLPRSDQVISWWCFFEGSLIREVVYSDIEGQPEEFTNH